MTLVSKENWRARAEAAEARVAELEREREEVMAAEEGDERVDRDTWRRAAKYWANACHQASAGRDASEAAYAVVCEAAVPGLRPVGAEAMAITIKVERDAAEKKAEIRGRAEERASAYEYAKERGKTVKSPFAGALANDLQAGKHCREHANALATMLEAARAQGRMEARSEGRALHIHEKHSAIGEAIAEADVLIDEGRFDEACEVFAQRELVAREEGRGEALRHVNGIAIHLAARLVRLSDRTPKRGDPAYDNRPEVVDREAVVDVAMELKRLASWPTAGTDSERRRPRDRFVVPAPTHGFDSDPVPVGKIASVKLRVVEVHDDRSITDEYGIRWPNGIYFPTPGSGGPCCGRRETR